MFNKSIFGWLFIPNVVWQILLTLKNTVLYLLSELQMIVIFSGYLFGALIHGGLAKIHRTRHYPSYPYGYAQTRYGHQSSIYQSNSGH